MSSQFNNDDIEVEPDLGLIWAEFEKMRIKHPRLKEAHRYFDAARRAATLSPYSPRRYVSLFAPTHSGKSMAVRTYIEQVVVDQAIERGLFPADMDRAEIALKQKLVLHVTLSQKATCKSLCSDILRRLGDRRADHGTTQALLGRVYDHLTDRENNGANPVELVILDELQHLSASVSKQPDGKMEKSQIITSSDVTDCLKTMMINGLVPMVLVGIEEAEQHLSIDTQLTGRAMKRLDFGPLRWSMPEERKMFQDYCGRLGIKLETHGLVRQAADLISGSIPHCFWAASGGCIGIVSRIVEMAVIHAVERGADTVEEQDLSLAVDTRAIPQGMTTYNPFQTGVRVLKVVGE